MDVRIVTFPETRVAKIVYRGAPADEHSAVRRLVAWKLERGLRDQEKYRTYGLHYADPRGASAEEYRLDICLSFDGEIEDNAFGVESGVIPAARCALARDVGNRMNNQAAAFLAETWLSKSGERPSGAPLIFHYVNVGPAVKEGEAITDVYLPLGETLLRDRA